ncbi:hypothetical protein BRARA_E00786 [Brassica rapa]|uniref:Uncharacterized protein n=3 Tax=Brassica TaxID=3705 RepID=A0A397ZH25_BRACM|nr:hypothetical protein BRARA_E00786 [Brassica rapa]
MSKGEFVVSTISINPNFVFNLLQKHIFKAHPRSRRRNLINLRKTAMPPKLDPSQILEVYIRVTGAASSLAPKKIGEYIAQETAKKFEKLDPSEIVDVYLRVTGGEVGAVSSLPRRSRKKPPRNSRRWS